MISGRACGAIENINSTGDTRGESHIERFVVGTLDNHMRANPSFVRNRSIIDEIIQTEAHCPEIRDYSSHIVTGLQTLDKSHDLITVSIF